MTLARTPAITNIGHNIDNFERRKEAIFDAFFQAVHIDRFAKVTQVRDILGFLRSCGHADLGSRIEVFQNSAPTAFLFRRSTMTLIHDNEVKEIRGKQFAEMLLIIVTNQLLIQREIHLMGSDGTLIILGNIDFMNNLFQRSEVLLNRLIHKNIAVSKVKNLTFQTALQHTVNNLESSIGFASTGSHDEQQAVLTSCNGIYGSVDSNTLIVTRRICILAAVIRLLNYRFLRRCHSRLLLEAGNQFSFSRELIQTELTLFTSKEIMLSKPIAIGTISKRKIKHLSIGHSLL